MVFEQCIGFLNTPALWKNEQFGIKQFNFPEIDTKALTTTAIPQNIRLGHQMEYVFKQLLESSYTYEVLIHNLPVKIGKRTIGEIDFIIRDLATQVLLHIELTYKFYIINPEITEPIHQLMGPNKRDMFFTKMEKIRDEQFALIYSESGRDALAIQGLNSNDIEQRTCYKAQLFSPYGTKKVHIRPLEKGCIEGYWLKFDEFNTNEFKPYQYYIPFKSEWVVTPHGDVQWCSHFQTLMDINLKMLKENAPMVWVKKSENTFEKFFVVWW
ncbi:DUF1853 family protein [Maribacter aestuarii]|uniref:DUF1853 family protein n=1 Tax=Maribacter aestuarii TaxID=1130723 RepID=UPI00248BC240|nr:DUF1853 family protein [Maribacter aestuarii]